MSMRMPLWYIPPDDDDYFIPFPGYGKKYRDYSDTFGHDPDTDAPWDAYIKAADTLEVVKSDNGVFTLSRNRSKSKADLTHPARLAWKELLRPSLRKLYTDITKEDIENFDLMLDSAEKDFQVFDDYLSETSDVIRHDSSVDDVIKQIPKSLITITGEHILPEIVKKIIKKVKNWHKKELFYKYALFLPTSELVKSATCPDDCLEKLKDDPGFIAAFGDIYSYKLLAQLKYYLSYRKVRANYGEPDSDYKTVVEKCRQWELDEHLEGYTIQPQVVEIMKIRSCSGVFIRGVNLPGFPSRPMEPSSSSSSPSSPMEPSSSFSSPSPPKKSRKRVWDY